MVLKGAYSCLTVFYLLWYFRLCDDACVRSFYGRVRDAKSAGRVIAVSEGFQMWWRKVQLRFEAVRTCGMRGPRVLSRSRVVVFFHVAILTEVV